MPFSVDYQVEVAVVVLNAVRADSRSVQRLGEVFFMNTSTTPVARCCF
jgi:spore germination cell wall hydrolase CwlJ-like protein